MAIILSIETSEKICSVALSKDYELIGTLQVEGEKSHASMLTVLIEKLMASKDKEMSELSAIAISMGPGSYTGLRIGVSVAKGLCYALGIPLIAINTLQILCYGIINSDKLKNLNISGTDILLCPMIDARRMEVYRALFNNKAEFISEVTAEIINEKSFSDELAKKPVVFFGSGAEKCRDVINNTNAYFIVNFNLNASYMISLAYDAYVQKRFENTAYFEPFYLKDFMATVPRKNKG